MRLSSMRRYDGPVYGHCVNFASRGIDFFPLSCDFEEKQYSVGKIPGGFIKREGRPTEKAILSSRLIDRPLRPLFPDGFRNDVQIVATAFSVDQDHAPDILGICGASIALTLSDIPFDGPIAAVSVAYVNDNTSCIRIRSKKTQTEPDRCRLCRSHYDGGIEADELRIRSP